MLFLSLKVHWAPPSPSVLEPCPQASFFIANSQYNNFFTLHFAPLELFHFLNLGSWLCHCPISLWPYNMFAWGTETIKTIWIFTRYSLSSDIYIYIYRYFLIFLSVDWMIVWNYVCFVVYFVSSQCLLSPFSKHDPQHWKNAMFWCVVVYWNRNLPKKLVLLIFYIRYLTFVLHVLKGMKLLQ